MKIKEEQLDYFRNILIDLEVTHVAVIDSVGKLESVFRIQSLNQRYLTDRNFLQSEEGMEKNEKRLVKFEYKENFFQITINPKNDETVYYHNNPENPELIFAQPYDFLVSKDWMYIFLPTENINLKSVAVLKASFERPAEKIENMTLDGNTPKEVLAFLENPNKTPFHDIRVYDQNFCDNFELIGQNIQDLELEVKKDFVKNINSFTSSEELLLASSKIAERKELYQLSFAFIDSIKETSNYYGKAFLEKLKLLHSIEDDESFLKVVNSYPYTLEITGHDSVMSLISKAVTFGFIKKVELSEDFKIYHEKWLHDWTEISVDPIWLALADKKVQQFIDEEIKPKNKNKIETIINYLVTDCYHKFPPPTSIPDTEEIEEEPSFGTPESRLLEVFYHDKLLINISEKELGNAMRAFELLIIHIDFNFVLGKVYNGYRGYKNRRDMMEQEGKQFAEDFLKNRKKDS